MKRLKIHELNLSYISFNISEKKIGKINQFLKTDSSEGIDGFKGVAVVHWYYKNYL